jgi:hypothetical protein
MSNQRGKRHPPKPDPLQPLGRLGKAGAAAEVGFRGYPVAVLWVATGQGAVAVAGKRLVLQRLEGPTILRLQSGASWVSRTSRRIKEPKPGLHTTVECKEVNMSTSVAKADLQERFQHLRDDWKSRSRYLSNSAQMAMLWSYQQIIGMGPDVVPLILAELQRETDHWFWALEAITGENPVPKEAAGKVGEMAQAWIRWGRRKGHIRDDTR